MMEGALSAEAWIQALRLQPHPEGGCFRETYRAEEFIAHPALPSRFKGNRAHSTAIYYLLRRGDTSALHRIQADEAWHHYDGDPLLVHAFEPASQAYRLLRLGKNLAAGEQPQAVVPHGWWFGAEVAAGSRGFALVGCTVAPGFDFADFELAKKGLLNAAFPEQRAILDRLSR